MFLDNPYILLKAARYVNTKGIGYISENSELYLDDISDFEASFSI